jgi:hypothetical protein
MKTWTPKAPTRQGPTCASHRLRSVGAGGASMASCPAPASRISTTTDRHRGPVLRARGCSDCRALRLFLQTVDAAPGPADEMFWVSSARRREGGVRHTRWRPAPEHRPADPGIPPPTLARSCLGPHAAMSRNLSDIDLQDRTLDAHGHNLPGWLTVNGPVQRRVRDFLRASTAAFDDLSRRVARRT